jgi:predicted ATP-grasp superfamily ATP-dependent carboligase
MAGVSTRAIAESAARAGLAVSALDAFGDRDQHPAVRAISLPRDAGVPFGPAACVRAACEVPCDAVAYLAPFENHPSRVEALARGRQLWGNGAGVLRRVRNPLLLMSTLRDLGFRTPATYRGRQAPPAGDLLVKPRASGGGHGVRRWTPSMDVGARAVLQERIDGVPASIVFVSAGGAAAPLGVSRQLVGDTAFGAHGYRYCGSLVAPRGTEHVLGFEPALVERAVALAQAVSAAFGLVGLNAVDFVAAAAEAVPIEVNPRWSGSMEMLDRRAAVPLFEMHRRACTTGALPPAAAATSAVVLGKGIVFARERVIAGDTGVWLEDQDVRDVPHPGDEIPAGGPVCTVFATGASPEACYGALVERAQDVYEALERWR